MHRLIIVGAGLLSIVATASAASAADLAARPYSKAPPVVAPTYNWSGFYIGLNGGSGSSQNCWDLTGIGLIGGPVAPVTPAVPEGCHNATGGLVGGQIGYRWQASSWVFGLEAQGDWASLKGYNFSLASATGVFGVGVTNQTKIDAIGLFTGQIGYAWNNVLWYVKGGAALTNNNWSGITTATGITRAQATEARWGGAVGTGLEFGFAPRWSVAVEYDHLFMGSGSFSFTSVTAPIFVTRTDSIKQDVDMGTVRVNYTFGGPIVAKY
ncbi:membrane protein [Bradyrhizobium sp. NAS80.1]|uniref:outer membrane protein n=1 Tax=Bradyrhizobium sp. NAS80.1 TaxID=1680159 RepID=UPI00095D9DE3|nr:outer membrane beta-barrel protein [Bradyrhizobium sp. NAS80.1]OKO68782.1 membrane protein [Bradyrhizobium sp. NAS80.1]